MPHTLDLNTSPKIVLQEASEALTPNGKLIIVGFNQRSLWRWYRFRHADFPIAATHSTTKLYRWLRHCQLQVIDTQTIFFRPLSANNKRMQKLQFMETLGPLCWPEWGATYIITAQKQCRIITPARRLWSIPKWATNFLQPLISAYGHKKKSGNV